MYPEFGSRCYAGTPDDGLDFGEEFDSLYGPEEEEVEKSKTKKSKKDRKAEKRWAEEEE